MEPLTKFFAAAEGRAIDSNFLGTNRRNIIDGLTAGSRAASDQTSSTRKRGQALPPKLATNRVERDVDSSTTRHGLNLLDKIFAAMIDSVIGAYIARAFEFFIATGCDDHSGADFLCDL